MDDLKNSQPQQPQGETSEQGALPGDGSPQQPPSAPEQAAPAVEQPPSAPEQPAPAAAQPAASQAGMPEGFQPYAAPQPERADQQPGAQQPGAYAQQPGAYAQQPGAQTPPPNYAPPVPPAQPGGYYGQAGAYGYAPKPSSGKAVAALVCGILAILFSWTILLGIGLGIAAIVLAGSAVKEAGKDGKATGGKVCGIVGIVLSVLALVATIALGALVGAAYNETLQITEDNYAYLQEDGQQRLDDGTGSADGSGLSALEVAEQEVSDLATAELDKLAGKDAAMVQELARELDDEMREGTQQLVGGNGISLGDAGLDSTAIAQWMLDGMTYSVDSVYIYASDVEADALAYINMRDVSSFGSLYRAKLNEAIGMASSLTTEQAAAAVNSAVNAAIAESADYVDVSYYIEFEKQGGTWTPDEHWYDDLVEYAFDL